MSFSLVVWKWAQNDLPGRADSIYQILGEEPASASIGSFELDPFLSALEPLHGRPNTEECPYVLSAQEDLETPATWVDFSITWSAAASVAPAIAEVAARFGLVAYDPQSGRLLPPGRPKHLVLEVEGRSPVYDPTTEEVAAALHQLNSAAPSFAILESVSGAYVQAAGDPTRMTVEWRTDSDPQFRHFVGGRGGLSFGSTTIQASGGHVTVRRNQVLSLAEALPVFYALLRGESPEHLLRWKDVTRRFR